MIVNDVAEKEEKFSKEESESQTDGQCEGETDEDGVEDDMEDDEQQQQLNKVKKVLSFEDWFQSFADYRLDQRMMESPSVENSHAVESAKDVENDIFNTSLKGESVEEQVKDEDGKTEKDDNVNVSTKSVTDGQYVDMEDPPKGQDTRGTKKRKREAEDKGAGPQKFLKTELNFCSKVVPITDPDIQVKEEKEEKEVKEETEVKEVKEEKEAKEEESGWRSRKKLGAWTARMGSMIGSWMNRLL